MAATPAGRMTRPSAARNASARAAGEIVGKLATLVLVAALARREGAAALGLYVLGLAYLEIVTLPVNLGLDRLLLRRVAREPARTAEIRAVWAVKLRLALPVALVAAAGTLALGYGPDEREVIAALAVGVLLESLRRTISSALTGLERGGLVAVAIVAQRVAAAAAGLACLAAGLGVLAVAAAFSAGAALGLAVAVLQWRRAAPAEPPPPLEGGLVRRSLPFAAGDVLGVLLFRIDAVILAALTTTTAVGRYGAAYRLLDATLFISTALTSAHAAQYTYLSETEVAPVFARSLKAALALLVPVALVLGTCAEDVLALLFGDGLRDAAPALRLLAPVAVLLGLVALCTSLVVSRRTPRAILVVTGVAVAANVVLNLVLIPASEERGAALAMLLTEVGLAVAALALALRTVDAAPLLPRMIGPLLAGAVALPCMLALDPFALRLIAGLGAYAAVLLAAERVLDPDGLRSLLRRAR